MPPLITLYVVYVFAFYSIDRTYTCVHTVYVQCTTSYYIPGCTVYVRLHAFIIPYHIVRFFQIFLAYRSFKSYISLYTVRAYLVDTTYTDIREEYVFTEDKVDVYGVLTLYSTSHSSLITLVSDCTPFSSFRKASKVIVLVQLVVIQTASPTRLLCRTW